ncbi:aldehyde dehydrogenase family protein [Mycobacterium sp. SMC-8]|uniref:aldehyde dehydrogenase family protein n=1 Tax=Mycobacterium sp. SMC-8 TaxID=2857060 RepID=UPI0021B41C8F|nr:aldehyde dehydrogenase family protein [Mycobacterium sp. SMC-8]UXA11543.1 aldehyde dehydrogenase family protein [Mycobacterium sp. SMC-8]
MTSATELNAVELPSETRMLVDGKLRQAASGHRVENVNPATGEVIGSVTDASAADMDEAMSAARRAFDQTGWSTDHEFRRRCLMQLHEALQTEKEAFRQELIAEAGATVLTTHMFHLDWPIADAIRWPAEYISTFPWERPLEADDKLGVPSVRKVVKEPIGVVGAITPWNFPFEIVSNKIGQILATGNTMVLKPAMETPWSALRFGRIIAEKTDIPAGVISIVPAADNSVAQMLLDDPRIDMVSFTGSTHVGKLIQQLSAGTMKRNLLELGGKSAYVVLDDADLQTALPGCIAAATHAGQGCALFTRLLVPRAMYAEALEFATAAYTSIAVGDPTDPQTFCGPLISEKQRQRVLDYLEIGRQEGARVTVGGGIPEHLDRGFYVWPTVLADVTPEMRVFQEEIFGPVLVVTPYDGGDDGAVALANNSLYGLAGAVFGSPERALAVGRRLRAGTVSVNGAMIYGADAPFGGYRLSGIGRQNGHEGFEQHLQTKSLAHL